MKNKTLINGVSYTKQELQQVADRCFDRTAFATELGYLYYNGRIARDIRELIEFQGLSIDHFDSTKKVKERRKYPVITKMCPVCSKEFETQRGHPREKITCSYACSNTYFAGIRHTDASRTKVSQSLKSNFEADCFERNIPSRISKECLTCRKPFEVLPSKADKEFCSSACSTKYSWTDPEYRDKILQAIQQRIADGTHKGWQSRQKLAPSFPEKVVMEILAELSLTYDRELKIGRWFIDFAFQDKKLALEIDGKQHEWPERAASDKEKDAFLQSQGWKVHRIKWKRLTKETRAELKSSIEILMKG
jgi:very-short-patch-repair endonuclease